MHAAHRFLALTVFTLALSACGGGGDDSEYTVTASAGTGGSVTPGSRTVSEGNTTTFTVSASDGYLLDTVSGCSGTLEGATYTTGPITANCEVQASFERLTVSMPDTVNENSTVKVEFSISGSESISAKITPANSWTSAHESVPTVKQVTGGFEIEVDKAQIRDPQYNLEVTVRKGGKTETVNTLFDVINVSGDHKYEYAKAVRESISGQRLFVGEMAMIEQLATIARMDGTQADIEAPKGFIARHNSIERILELKAGVGNAYVLDTDMEKYEENNPHWEASTGWVRFNQYTRLETCADSAAYCFATHLGAGADMFDAFFESTNWSYATPATGHVEFDGRTKTYSVFYVDGVNGEFDELGNWSFNEDLAYLTAIIQAGHQAAVEYTAKLK